MKLVARLGSVIFALALCGCSFKGAYNASYLPAQPMRVGLPGKGLVVLSVAEQQKEFAAKPTSFTGGASTLTLPLGDITKQVALKVFGAAFVDGADFASEVPAGGEYRLVVRPVVRQLNYGYNQLKNLGFAITPQVNLDLQVSLLAPDGSVQVERTYSSGLVDGDTYVVSGKPAEKVNQLVHLTLFKLMTDAALEMRPMVAELR